MGIYLHDFITLIILGVAALIAWKVKQTKFKVGVGGIALALILFNPIRFEVPRGNPNERFSSSFEELPEKEEAQRQSFVEKQAAEHEHLKQQSKDLQNEI